MRPRPWPLLGSDVALCAVDTLSIRYRSKQKNIGKAASEAFAEAAQRLGVTVDELGDRVVPWLGFEPGQPRLIEHQDKRIEVRIGLDFKLELRDLVKGKKIASLPAGIPAEVKNDLKELGATLREVVKGQLVRIENLMVRQFRWPVARWRELFLGDTRAFPLRGEADLGPLRDSDGRLLATFRALEDRTLTNKRTRASIAGWTGSRRKRGHRPSAGVSAEQRQAWAVHLADYNVQSPFLQLERPVIRARSRGAGGQDLVEVQGHRVERHDLQGPAERLGWQRGSVVDAGRHIELSQEFSRRGADAILELGRHVYRHGHVHEHQVGPILFRQVGQRFLRQLCLRRAARREGPSAVELCGSAADRVLRNAWRSGADRRERRRSEAETGGRGDAETRRCGEGEI